MGKTSTSWEKGQSGNPRGGPLKGNSYKEILERIMGEIIEKEGDFVTQKEAMLMSAFKIAMNPEIEANHRLKAMDFLADREEGKPVQTQNVQINQDKLDQMEAWMGDGDTTES